MPLQVLIVVVTSVGSLLMGGLQEHASGLFSCLASEEVVQRAKIVREVVECMPRSSKMPAQPNTFSPAQRWRLCRAVAHRPGRILRVSNTVM